MHTITLYVDHITGAQPHDDDETIEVICEHTDYRPLQPVTRKLVLDITAHSVHVTDYHAPDRKPDDVLVSTGLIDATRRLYNLVGKA